MKIGFTGARGGMTLMQKVEVGSLLLRELAGEREQEVHHGGCKGADAEFDTICHELRCDGRLGEQFVVVVHPSSLKGWRGTWGPGRVLDECPPLERNHHIVDAVELMIAVPAGVNEVLRSGTWACIRYARKRGREMFIVYPNGSVKGV